MLPLLNLGSGVAGSRSPKRILSPPNFMAVRGVRAANFSLNFISSEKFNVGRTPAQRAGLRYERKVIDALIALFGDRVLPSPWIDFTDHTMTGRVTRGRRCQPDALIFFPGRVVIVEIKLSHVERAWWQLRWLYEPVVRKLFPLRNVECLEISQAYDPAIEFPEPVVLLDWIEELAVPPNSLYPLVRVMSWKL